MSTRTIIALLFVLVAAACIEGPAVTQGTVIQVDKAAKVLVVRDERPPNEEMTFSFAGAEVGADPSEGDLVRLAWKERGGQKVATRIMNLTRQEELKAQKK